MKTSTRYITLIGLFAVILLACKKDPVPNFHREYFGNEQGQFVVYDVMEITHDQALAQHDTVYYQLKTVWGDTVIDNEGRVAREFNRYTRAVVSDPWQFSDLWTGLIDGIRAELMEENQRTVKLVFAPTLSKSWDANAYNMQGELDCYYREIHQDTIINGNSFDSTVTVEQDDFTSLIDTVRKYEVYAKGVGMVYKHFKDNHYQFTSSEVVNGKEVYMTFVSSGYE
jgi:hypothetical protein